MKKIILMLFCGVSLILTGCANFLAGVELKERIEDAIEIANSKEISIEINSKIGSISPSGIVKTKKLTPFEIELSVKSGCIFEGEFNVFKKSDGKNTKISEDETPQLIKFVEKSQYNAGVGNINYVYEITLLKDTYESILINPEIINPDSSQPLEITDIKVEFRYPQQSIVDYFDISLYVEGDTVPSDSIYLDYLDSEGHPLFVSDGMPVKSYPAVVENVGNGNYYIYSTVDLRKDNDFSEKVEFTFDVSLIYGRNQQKTTISHNDIFPDGKLFIKQSYSATQVLIYNYYSTNYNYTPVNKDLFLQGKENLTQFSKSIKLMVNSIDTNGLGLAPDGTNNTIKYGITQNQAELENLELNNIISDYNSYDFDSEVDELSNVYEKQYIPEDVHNQILDYYEKLYSGELDEEEAIQLEFEIYEILDYWNHIIELEREEENTKIISNHEKAGLTDKSIIEITLPQGLNNKKDTFIKVSTDNGINNSDFVVFTIPATPSVLGIEKNYNNWGTTTVELEMYAENQNVQKKAFVFDPDLDKWTEAYGSFTEPDYYEKNGENCLFYVGALLKSGEISTGPVSRYFDLYSLDFDSYSAETKPEQLTNFSENAKIEIKAGEVNSSTHQISLELNKAVFNQFDKVFAKYKSDFGSETLYELALSPENKVSFSLNSTNFFHMVSYNGDEETGEGAFKFGERRDLSFYIIGTKNGNSYSTKYIISATDNRIIDNVPPEVPLSYVFNFETGDFFLSNVIVDSTGSYLTIEGHPQDIGNSLAESVPVTIKYNGKNLIYTEEYSCTGLRDKYLTIPISHLKNGEYTMIISIQDSFGNTGSETFDFVVNRTDISKDCKIEKVDENKFKINYKNYESLYGYISHFDSVQNQWNISSEDFSNGIEKTGILQLHINNQKNNSDNYYNYPFLFHYPENAVSYCDYLLLRNSIHLYSDKPFFIHIIKSDIDWGKNADDWEHHQSYTYNIENDNYTPFEGCEVDPRYVTHNNSTTPYIYSIPWEKLDKKYAAAVVIWGDNKKYLIPIDLNLKN